MREWTEGETAWVAGLLEGEGSFTSAATPKCPGKVSAGVKLNMVDEDVVRRFAELCEAGHQVRPRPTRNGWQPQWSVQISGETGREIMRRVRPWMGARRGQRIDELTARWEEKHAPQGMGAATKL